MLPDEITLTVTQEHINNGRRKDCGFCPIALSARELYPKEYVEVGSSNILIGSTQYQCSDEAFKFIINFDRKIEVKPSTFVFKKIYAKSPLSY